MNIRTVRNKSVQVDMLNEAARVMQLAACIDDAFANEINALINKVEEKACELEARIGEPEYVRPERQTPKLTIVQPILT